MNNEATLVLTNVTRAYRAGIPSCGASIDVLRSVSLEMRPGDLTLIEGAAACGKTTLLLCAAGLLRPDSGAVQWPALGTRTTQAPKTVRYVGDRATTYGFLTVRESLAYAITLREIDEPRMAPLDYDPLDIVGLRDLTGTRVALLSRGERARFLIALALVSEPKLLLVDDLTADCDAVACAAFASCLSRVASSGRAVLWGARSVGPVTPDGKAYELVRGRLRERIHTPRVAAPIVDAAGEQSVLTHPHVSQRVAEP
jgi:ABC-type multidrug transport system ATPase subunit